MPSPADNWTRHRRSRCGFRPIVSVSIATAAPKFSRSGQIAYEVMSYAVRMGAYIAGDASGAGTMVIIARSNALDHRAVALRHRLRARPARRSDSDPGWWAASGHGRGDLGLAAPRPC